MRTDGVIPFAVEFGAFQTDLCELFVADLDSCFVFVVVESGSHDEAGVGGRVADELYAGEWSATPVARDETEHAMFDFVPLAGARTKMTDMQRQRELVGQFLQRDFPQSIAATVSRIETPAIR